MNIIRRLLAAATLGLLAHAAQAQMPMITDAMIQQRMAAMNANIARGQGMVQDIVQRRMQDPAVQAAWQQYVAQTGGRPAMNYATFTYYYIYTAGYSAQGRAHMARVESGIQQREQAAWQGVQQAERQRGAAQQAQRDGYFANQQEAGRHLMGQSTYFAPNGAALQLPHTWQPNRRYVFQGNTYQVDASGTYHVLGTDGWWYPLQPR